MNEKIVVAQFEGKTFHVGHFKTFWDIEQKLTQSYIDEGFLLPAKYSSGSGVYHVFYVRETIRAGIIFALVKRAGMLRKPASELVYAISDHDIDRFRDGENKYLCWLTGTDGTISPPMLRDEFEMDDDQSFLGVINVQEIIGAIEKAL